MKFKCLVLIILLTDKVLSTERVLYFDIDKAFKNESIEEDVTKLTDYFIDLLKECISATLIRNLDANVQDVMNECLGEGKSIMMRLFDKINTHSFGILKIRLIKVLKNICKDNNNQCGVYFKFVDFCIKKNYNLKDSLPGNERYMKSKINYNLYERIIEKSKDILNEFENLRHILFKKRHELLQFIEDKYNEKEDIVNTFNMSLKNRDNIQKFVNNNNNINPSFENNNNTRELIKIKLANLFRKSKMHKK